MNWFKACLSHKLVVYLFALALSLGGLFALFNIPITPFPLPSSSSMSIQISYPGANADAVQTQVTQKVTNSLASLGNIKYMQATSSAGSSQINLELNSSDINTKLQTQIKINQAINAADLPSNIPSPTITSSTSQSSLVSYAVSSSKLNLFQIDNFIQSTLAPNLRNISGVTVQADGREPIVKIKLIPEKLAAYHIDASQIAQFINQTYKTNPLGAIYVKNKKYQLGFKGDIKTLADFRNLLVGFIGYSSKNSGQPIYLKDIATVSFESMYVIDNSFSTFNGNKADMIALLTHGVANPFVVEQKTNHLIQQITQRLPSWIAIQPLYNVAKTMRIAISEVVYTIIIATILVLCIALMFLGHFRTTVIPIVIVPICLLGTMGFISAAGYSINLLTLLALVIAVGLVVDDAIVVIENITRHIEMGLRKREAVLEGTADIAITIVGITATLLAVYLPITFSTGTLVGFLRNFAMPLAVAVLLSGILSLTLTPVMAVTFMSDGPQNKFQKKFTALIKRTTLLQNHCLEKILDFPFSSLILIVLTICVAGYYALKVPSSLFPQEPSNQIIIMLDSSAADTLQSLQKKIGLFSIFYRNKTVDFYSTTIKSNQNTGRLKARIYIKYKPKYLHQNSQFVHEINNYIKKHNISNANAQLDLFLNGGNNSGLSLVLFHAGTTQEIDKAATKITRFMKRSPIFTLVTNTINQPQKQLEFSIDEVKAARFSIFKTQLSRLLSVAYGGLQLNNNFNIAGLSVPVLVQLDSDELKDPQSFNKLQIESPVTTKFLPISDFVQINTVAKPIRITTFNNQPAVEINANFKDGQTMAEGIQYVNQLLRTQTPTVSYKYLGSAAQFIAGNQQTKLVMILGLVCVYFLLAILFGNLVDPFIIMLTIPFTIIGGALSLYLINGTINLFSILGLITLIGLITKHGVLVIKFANTHLKNTHSSVREAILVATQERFRPIMMTTFAMVLGALPLVLSSNLLYVSRQSLGIVIIIGLLVGTLFSLFIVPLVYSLIKRIEVRGEHIINPKGK